MRPIRILALTLLCACSTTDAAKVHGAWNAGVTCGTATCGSANSSPACTALEADVLACLVGTATGNPAACIAAAPSAIAIGYADLVCVLADIATKPASASPATASAAPPTQASAARVLAAQRVLVKQGVR